MLAQRANPDKELRLVDSVKEMFANQGIFLPERLSIRRFTEAVEAPEKYKPERKVRALRQLNSRKFVLQHMPAIDFV